MAVGLAYPEALFPIDGVRLAYCSAGIYSYKRDDLVLIELNEYATTTAVFTENAFKAAPVIVAGKNIHKTNPRYLLINAGNANSGTGERGIKDILTIAQRLAPKLRCSPDEILPFSTGIIGEYLPVERICNALPELIENLSTDHWLSAANAIMTTDTIPKAVSRRIPIEGIEVSITGIAKGAGMIRPNMATLLSFIATDIFIDKSVMNRLFSDAVNKSFNCISVDGDTSTNDACVFISSSTNKDMHITSADSKEYKIFSETLSDVCIELAQKIVRDGEGASKFVTIEVQNGSTDKECRTIAYSIAESPLVKTAIHGSNPNWGRFLSAIGKANVAKLDSNKIAVYLNDFCIVDGGCRHEGYTEKSAQAAMQQKEIYIRVDLNRGHGNARIWTCDLSHEYITINSEYHT